MKNLCLFCALSLYFINMSLAANFHDLWPQKLDLRIQKILDFSHRQKNLTSILGNPQEIKDNKLFYILDNYKYALCLQYENGKLKYLNYRLPLNNKLALNDFVKNYPDSSFKQSFENKLPVIILEDTSKGYTFVFSADDNKKLKHFTLRQK